MISKTVVRFMDSSSKMPISPTFLLKTFSVNPFQGQYPNMAVGIIATPISPRIHPETPEIRKAKAIKIPPYDESQNSLSSSRLGYARPSRSFVQFQRVFPTKESLVYRRAGEAIRWPR